MWELSKTSAYCTLRLTPEQSVLGWQPDTVIAILPPKWQAGVREQSAESTFLRGGWPG